MTRIDAQQAVVTLYLRLNGYFTSGFIVHSDVPGQNRTELDVLAVRLPHNSEPEREVGGAPELDRWDGGIDFIIGEVKSRRQPLQFNGAIRTSSQAVASILRWCGHLTEDEVLALTDPVRAALGPAAGATGAPTVTCPRNARIRAILFRPDQVAPRRPQQSWYVPGTPLFRYIWECLRPKDPRADCATTYDFGRWGSDLERVVRYFKDPARDAPGSFADLARHLGL
jgi:hypothetical protein